MRNDPIDMGALVESLMTAATDDIPFVLSPKEALKLHGEIKTLRAMVGRLVAEREKYRWVSVEERLPDEGQYVFVRYDGSGVRGFDFVVDGRRNCKGVLANNVTHWMPLPEPPESEA